MYNRCSSAGYGHARGEQHHHQGFRGFRAAMGGAFRRPKYNVPVNIAEREDAWEVSVYAVGFDKANIKLSVSDENLYITGTREAGDPAPQFTKQEFPVKSFERVLSLGGAVDVARISARQEGGVLLITLPKTEAAKTPDVEIPVA